MWYLLKPIVCAFEIVCCTLAEPTENPAGRYQYLKTLNRRGWRGRKENAGKTFVKSLVLYYSIAKGDKINSNYPLRFSSMSQMSLITCIPAVHFIKKMLFL